MTTLSPDTIREISITPRDAKLINQALRLLNILSDLTREERLTLIGIVDKMGKAFFDDWSDTTSDFLNIGKEDKQ